VIAAEIAAAINDMIANTGSVSSGSEMGSTARRDDLVDDFMSLPPQVTQTMSSAIDKLVAEGNMKKEMSESNLYLLNVGYNSGLKSAEWPASANDPSQFSQAERIFVNHSDEESGSVLSLIEKMMQEQAPQETSEKPTSSLINPFAVTSTSLNGLNAATYDKNLLFGSVSSSAINNASASSPNPECSPFKFLLADAKSNKEPSSKPEQLVHTEHNQPLTFSSLKHISTADVAASTNTASDMQLDSEQQQQSSVESLVASLVARKECETVDPILATSFAMQPSEAAPTANTSDTKASPTLSMKLSPTTVVTATELLQTNNTLGGSSPSAEATGLHVPASSREFCMSLNFDLAATAAASACAPVAIVTDNTGTSPKVCTDHNRFTSNASTSSIHNDLKMILEESKGKPQATATAITTTAAEVSTTTTTTMTSVSPVGSSEKKRDLVNSPPKPQRAVRSPSKMTSHGSPKNTTDALLPPLKQQQQQAVSPTTKLSPSQTGIAAAVASSVPSTIDWSKQRQQLLSGGKHRYEKEFLLEIRNQRAQFISQIYPELFKAYCYCSNGKYWDPEKYFDVVQFPGEHDRAAATAQGRNARGNYYHNKNQHYQQHGGITTTTNTINNNNSYQHNNKRANGGGYYRTPNPYSLNNTTPRYNANQRTTTPASNYHGDNNSGNGTPLATLASTTNTAADSPQPLQVPKNSPRTINATEAPFVNELKGLNESLNNLERKFRENHAKKEDLLASFGLNLGNNLETARTGTQLHDQNIDKCLMSMLQKENTPPAPQITPEIKKQQHQHPDYVTYSDMLLYTLLNKTKPAAPQQQPQPQQQPEPQPQHQQQSPSILDSLFLSKSASGGAATTSSSTSPKAKTKHFPRVLTAQELEMDHLLAKESVRNKLPVSESELFAAAASAPAPGNNSEAYKQLVKNLSTHPLNATSSASPLSSASSQSPSNFNDMLNKMKAARHSERSSEATKALKLMLNLAPTTETQPQEKQGKRTSKSKNKNHKSHKSPEGSRLKFPAVNPHEKPFEQLISEENRKQIEKVVANALNQVLNPSGAKSSKTPKTPTAAAATNSYASPSHPQPHMQQHHHHHLNQHSYQQQQQQQPKSPIESLFEKLTAAPAAAASAPAPLSNEQVHFSALLSKMTTAPSPPSANADHGNILKWFQQQASQPLPAAASSYRMPAASLSEIELMLSSQPQQQQQQQPMYPIY